MAYPDFTLQSLDATFGITAQVNAVFENSAIAAPPAWLVDQLRRGLQLPLVSEKARSELIVMPILLACRELSGETVAIYSGSRLDVSAAEGLLGECDYIVSRGQPLPEVRAPLLLIVEAKKNDVEAGLGQCVAQMLGAQRFNSAHGREGMPLYGCVTTGEVWQFLRLRGTVAELDRTRLYLDNLPGILGVLAAITAPTSEAPR
jgi:hypothetical protein